MGCKINVRGSLARSLRLRDSYIGISEYFQGQPLGTLSHLRPRTRPTCSNPWGKTFSTSIVNRLTASTPVRHVGTDPSISPPKTLGTEQIEVQASRHVEAPAWMMNKLLKEYSDYSDPRGYQSWNHLATVGDALMRKDEGSLEASIRLAGYITSQRPAGQNTFMQLVDPSLRKAVQLVLKTPKGSKSVDGNTGDELQQTISAEGYGRPDPASSSSESGRDSRGEHSQLQRLDNRLWSMSRTRPHTPVTIVGRIVRRLSPPKRSNDNAREEPGRDPRHSIRVLDPHVGEVDLIPHIEIEVTMLKRLNSFPPDLVAKHGTGFGPEQRHLQIRTDHSLRRRLRLRSRAMAQSRKNLFLQGFDEIETPLLFKSTPEGAREFIVPSRKKGLAYALPQSPQQYKQLLMASGIPLYFQFAKCFRDEDSRADRQPEFTQLDLEMAFATSARVMKTVENLLLKSIFKDEAWATFAAMADYGAVQRDETSEDAKPFSIPRLTYETAMSLYGSDKPDLRLESKIVRIDDWLPASLRSMLSSLQDPIVEMLKVDMRGTEPETSRRFIASFLDEPSSKPFVTNSDGMPGVAIFDLQKPLNGLASFGHEGAAQVEKILHPDSGDIIVVQTRPQGRFTGGSTVLGNLRRDIHQAAISQDLTPPPNGVSMLWVTDFPLFSPMNGDDPGQEGAAGICSTHHPFTAPRPGEDLSKLLTDPLSVIGDHYDLVINGVEVGGGSRRIHTATMQEFILSGVLKMKPERVEAFRHLLNALASGCPPHAGFALGFDRLMALLTDMPSVRDVIAFPKSGDGEDKFVGSPTPLTPEQLSTYHLAVSDDINAVDSPRVSLRA